MMDLTFGALLTSTGLADPIDRGDVRAAVEDQMATVMSAPAVADEPWSVELGRETAAFELSDTDYTPYLFTDPHPFRSDYVNSSGIERRTYDSSAVGGSAPLEIALFGGSAAFGVGQRDDHTVASELARTAAEQGVAVRVHNYGYPDWVSWQDLLYFERVLAREEHIDMALFLDGADEFQVQADEYSPDPTHAFADGVGGLVQDFREQRARPPGAFDAIGELASSYRRNSGVVRLLDRLVGRPPRQPGQDLLRVGSSDEQTDAALDIYQRASRLSADVGSSHGVPTRFFWQPRASGWPQTVLDRLPPATKDLSDAVAGDQDDLFLDDANLSEQGARLVAEAIWADIEDSLEDGSAPDSQGAR